MLVPDDVRKCVVFLAIKIGDGFRPVGTAWFVGEPIDGTSHHRAFLVTAKHVIDGVRSKGADKVFVRYNVKNGTSAIAETKIDGWLVHPSDQTVDVAVFQAGIPEDWDHLLYPTDRFATREILRSQNIGIGEELFLTGLFANHVGQSRNIPILRVGNIAAMPEENVSTRMGPMEAYLVEARSIGGLSGSPVFVHLGLARHIDGSVKFAQGGAIFYLLGLMHGHWDVNETSVDGVASDGAGASNRSVNMGIGIVVPAWHILPVLNRPEFLR